MQADAVTEQAADAFDDGKPQTGAAIVGDAIVQTAEFFEDFMLQCFGNAGSLIVHFDAQPAATATTADQHPPTRV